MSMRGTWSWMSPELLLQNGPIGTACDIYSLGMVRAAWALWLQLHPMLSEGHVSFACMQTPCAAPGVYRAHFSEAWRADPPSLSSCRVSFGRRRL